MPTQDEENRKQAARSAEGIKKANGINYNPMLVDPMETNFIPNIPPAKFETADLKPKPKGI